MDVTLKDDEGDDLGPAAIIRMLKVIDAKHVYGHNNQSKRLSNIERLLQNWDERMTALEQTAAVAAVTMKGLDQRHPEFTSIRYSWQTVSALCGFLVAVLLASFGGQKWANFGTDSRLTALAAQVTEAKAAVADAKLAVSDARVAVSESKAASDAVAASVKALSDLQNERSVRATEDIRQLKAKVEMVDTKITNVMVNQRK